MWALQEMSLPKMRQAYFPLWFRNFQEKLSTTTKIRQGSSSKSASRRLRCAVLAFSSWFLRLKTRNEFSLHPRGESGGGGEGNLFKLKFVTVGRTVALQPRPISGYSASQLHCKGLKILPPTPEYIYIYICILKKIPCPSLSTQKDLITLQK